MARLIWTRRAINDLDEIAEFTALDDESAAKRLTDRVVRHAEQLKRFPKIGSVPLELDSSEYRQIVEPPCRVFYKIKGSDIYIIHVIRSERILRLSNLEDSE